MSKRKSMRITCVLLSAVGAFCLLTACGSESESIEPSQNTASESATDHDNTVDKTPTPSQSDNNSNSQRNRANHNSSKDELIAI